MDCYDAVLWPAEKLGLASLRKGLVSKAQGKVLEIGVGTGLNLPYYPKGCTVTATDVSGEFGEAVKKAARSKASVRFVTADAQRLPFADASFDTVVATLVFCTIPDPQEALAECRRVLRKGGTLLLLEHVRPDGALGNVADAATPLWKRLAGGCRLDRETAQAVRQAGFKTAGRERYLGFLELFSARKRERDAGER